MDRMKTFLKYFIIFLVFYFASNVVSAQMLKSTYKNKEVFPDFESPKIEITDCKATISNGYITGKITNDTGKDLFDQVLELDFFTKRNNNVGTKFIDIGNLMNGETKEFSTKFNFDNVSYIKAFLMGEQDALKRIENSEYFKGIKGINDIKNSIKSLKDLKNIDGINKLFSIDDIKNDKFPWYVWFFATIIVSSVI